MLHDFVRFFGTFPLVVVDGGLGQYSDQNVKSLPIFIS